MRLLAIEANDFLSYPSLDLDLAGINRLAVVGRNGSGKSALLDAILWCCFGKGRGMSDEMIRDGALSCWVKTTWERKVNGLSSLVVITRSRDKATDESSLAVYEDGEEISKSKIPLTQALIEKLIGMGYEAMCSGPVMIQPGSPGSPGSLLQKKPAEAKDLLVELFQLERWSAYHDAAKADRDKVNSTWVQLTARHRDLVQAQGDESMAELEKEVATYETALEVAEQELEQLRGRLTELREEAATLRERSKRAETLGAEIEDLVSDIGDAQESLAKAHIARDTAVATIETTTLGDEPTPPAPLADLTPLREEHAAAIRAVTVLTSERDRRPGIQSRLRDAMQRLGAAKGSVCPGNPPGCQYAKAVALAQDEVTRLGAEMEANAKASSQDKIDRADRLVDDLAAKISDLQGGWESVQGEYQLAHRSWTIAKAMRDSAAIARDSNNQRITELTASLGRSEAKHREAVKQRLGLQQDEYRMAELATLIDGTTSLGLQKKGEVDELRKAITTDQAMIEALQRIIDELAETVTKMEAAEDSLVLYAQVIKMFHRDGIPTLILETAVPEIERRANDVLERLPDDYTIRLDTKVATKSQTFKDELRVVVLSGGRERPFHMLSGGQRFRVEFAIRIALSSVIAARVDATVDTLWLDEPLGQLDKEGQDAVSDTLAAFADDFGLIVVVSHVADFNDQQETKVAVTIDEGESTAAIAA